MKYKPSSLRMWEMGTDTVIEIKEGKNGKKEHTNNLLNIVMLISIVIIIVAWISAGEDFIL